MLISNKNLKRFFRKIILLVFAILLLLTVKSYAMVSPTKDFYVNDYANILDPDLEKYIISTNISLEEQTGAQVVVVTINSLEGNSLEDYANELFKKFGIGDKTKNNGVLLLCSVQDRMFRIEVGDGLEGRLTDGKTGRIQDNYIIPYLKENNWNDGIRNGYNAVLEEIAEEYDVTIKEAVTPNKIENSSSSRIDSVCIVLMFVSYFVMVAQTSKKVKIKLIVIDLVAIVAFTLLGSLVFPILFDATKYLISILLGFILSFCNVFFFFFGGGFGGGSSSGSSFSGGGGHSSGGGSSRSF